VRVESERRLCDRETRLAGGDELRHGNLQTLRGGLCRPRFPVNITVAVDPLHVTNLFPTDASYLCIITILS